MKKVCGIETKKFEQVSVQDILEYFKGREQVQYDSETRGFDCHTCPLLCFQLGDAHNQFIIHASLVGEFKEFLETTTLIAHNAKFDLKFLYKHGIWPRSVWDTFIAESLITCGLKQAKRSLAAVAKNRLDIDLDKSVRMNIMKEGLSDRVIEYSGEDVHYLEAIQESQMRDIERLQLQGALDIENQFVRCLAYIEYSGMRLNASRWKHKIDNDIEKVRRAETKLNDFIISNKLSKFIDYQIDMFNPGLRSKINWSSSKQVVSLFKELKIPTVIVDKGIEKDSVESKHIGKYEEKFPIVKDYLLFKEYEKVITTYGENFLKQINPVTGRLHTQFKQIMDTGRTSSGGKDGKVENINFQNIPRDKETRSCFYANEGNILVIGDFSGQEQVVLANKTLDANLLEFYDNGGGDMHCFVASKMYSELAEVPFAEIKKNHSEKRQNAKIAGFVVNYGGVAKNIAEQLNVSMEQGEEVFSSYFKAFPGMEKAFTKAKKEGLERGYILVSEHSGRKSFIDGYEEYQALNKEINRSFWDNWKRVKELGADNYEYKAMKAKISTFFKIKGAIERKSLNFPIQGTSAEISKMAGVYFFNWIIENEYMDIVLIPNFVHDEYVAESPKEIAKQTRETLKSCMESAGALYCKRVPLKADPVISHIWEH